MGWKVGAKFKVKVWVWPLPEDFRNEDHIVKSIIEENDGDRYIIAEDGQDYGYIGESDKILIS